MKITRGTRRYVIGWWIVALATLCQAPLLYGDPLCPNCAGKAPAPQIPLPTFEPVDLAPQPEAHAHPHPVVAQPTAHHADEIDVPVPIVKLKIRVPACAEVGKELEYRIKVQNSSPADAHNVTVRMNLPASVKILRASPQIHQRDPELQWNLGTLPGYGCHDIVVMIVPIGLADIKSCTRVTFEHGQCVTTKVMAFAPQAGDGRGGIPGAGDHGGPGGMGPGGVGPGGLGGRGDFDVRIFSPEKAAVGQPVTYKITMFNKGTSSVYKAGVSLDWGNDLEEVRPHDELIKIPGIAGGTWPKGGLFEELPPNSSKSLDLVLRSRGAGRFCLKASASASLSQNPNDNRIVNAKDEVCTEFHRGIPGMTLEMFDREDPILKNGLTSYPITVRNQGKDPITNLQIKARVPDLFEVDQVRGPGKYRSGLIGREFWVEYEPLSVLNVGETQTFEIFVKGKGQIGDARFHVEMTADQLDRGPGGAARWIIEEESTILVQDEETRIRIRDISLKNKRKAVSGTVTSGK